MSEKKRNNIDLLLSGNTEYSLFANGQEVKVYCTSVADFATIVSENENCEITLKANFPENGVIRPITKNKEYAVNNGELKIVMTTGDKLSVEPENAKPLFLSLTKPIVKPENITYYYESGKIYDIGILSLKANETVYIENDAIVCGTFCADQADNISILGNGIILGTLNAPHVVPSPRIKTTTATILLVECNNVKVEGVNIIDSPYWTLVPTFCKNVHIDNISIIGIVISSDGIDVVGCEDVLIENTFVFDNDDCVVIKAVRYFDERGANPIKNVTVRKCVLWNYKCGNAIEIGYETSAFEICDILFEDIDVIHCQKEGWQSGGVFTIHNGDRARVHDITYRNIRVEQAEEKLVDFKILSSRYSSDLYRGTIDNILLEDIHIVDGAFPPSIIRGFETDLGSVHGIKNIKFKNLRYKDKVIKNQLDAHLVAEITENITFEK